MTSFNHLLQFSACLLNGEQPRQLLRRVPSSFPNEETTTETTYYGYALLVMTALTLGGYFLKRLCNNYQRSQYFSFFGQGNTPESAMGPRSSQSHAYGNY